MICPNCGHLQAPEVERDIRQRERKLLADILSAHVREGDLDTLLDALDVLGESGQVPSGSASILERFVRQLVGLCREVTATSRQEALAERRRKRMMRG